MPVANYMVSSGLFLSFSGGRNAVGLYFCPWLPFTTVYFQVHPLLIPTFGQGNIHQVYRYSLTKLWQTLQIFCMSICSFFILVLEPPLQSTSRFQQGVQQVS